MLRESPRGPAKGIERKKVNVPVPSHVAKKCLVKCGHYGLLRNKGYGIKRDAVHGLSRQTFASSQKQIRTATFAAHRATNRLCDAAKRNLCGAYRAHTKPRF